MTRLGPAGLHTEPSAAPGASARSPYRRYAILCWIAAAAMVAAALASLLYALYSGSQSQWPAILWQLCQLLAILSFGIGLWNAYQHRRWQLRQRGEDDEWD